ncbi:protein SPMIP1-like [Tubulanus polymorphus]|uniref:protein SPMIP1-like n=1 Tax=Tubulanus polymorphus TaxID=672921 RepID=UPI003DA63725
MTSRGFPADTATQKFLEQVFDKERDSLIYWYQKSLKNGTELQTEASSKQYEVFKKKIAAHNVDASVEEIAKKLAETPQSDRSLGRRDVTVHPDRVYSSEELAEMRPVSNCSRAMLYNGISRDGKGRQQYLNRRTEKIPEKKYEFPVVSSWEYGWGLSDVKKDDIKKPQHGRTRVIDDTFYNRNGVENSDQR